MTTVTIDNHHRVHLPPEVQNLAPVGTRLQVSIDETGRIILTPNAETSVQRVDVVPGVDEDFARQVADFIEQYRPSLEALAR